MLINEITNPLAAPGAWLGGVAKQLGRNMVRGVTGKDYDDLTARTPTAADVYNVSATQPDGDIPDSAENIPQGSRLAVQNPQKTATFYKYSDGKWYDEFGTLMPKTSWDALEAFADSGAGRIEKIPPRGISGFRTRGRKAGSV